MQELTDVPTEQKNETNNHPTVNISDDPQPAVVVRSPPSHSQKFPKPVKPQEAHWSPWFYFSDQFSKLLAKFTRRKGSKVKLNLSCFRRALWTDEERELVELFSRAILSLHSSILFWVGASNFLSESSTYDENRSWTILPPSLGREIIYVLVGVILLFATDSFYGNSGLPGSFLRQKWKWNRRPLIVIIRATFSMLGSVLTWSGIYNILDIYILMESSFERDLIYLIVGIAGTVLTNTFYDMAMVHPPGYNQLEFDHSTFTFRMHLRESIRAFTSLFFQNLIWCGGFNLLEVSPDPDGLCWWREFAYVALGILLLWLTNAFIPNSWVLDEMPQSDFTELKQQDPPSQTEIKAASKIEFEPAKFAIDDNVIDTLSPVEPFEHPEFPLDDDGLTLSFYTRAFIALIGQIVHNTGVWQLCDVYLSRDSVLRNLLYLIFGLLLVLLTGGGGKHRTLIIFDEEQGYIPSPLTSARLK